MKYVHIIISGLFRRKMRTILTLGSFIVAFFLFGILATLRFTFSQGVELAGVDRLAVINKTSLIMPLPYSYLEQIRQIEGVAGVTFSTWFGGVYQDESNFFPQFAIDHESFLPIFPEYVFPQDQWQEFLKDRQGCIVGKKLAERFGWKLGDRIPIQGTIWSGTWEFNIQVIYDGKRPEDDTTGFYFRWDYLDERREFGKGTVGWYIVKVANPDKAVEVSEAIDKRFANSPYETNTQTEKAFALSFSKQIGNIEFLLMSIGSVVLFTLLLVTGNTMAISVRERTHELAVFKAIGYSNLKVLLFILIESMLLALIGGSIGIALAKLFTLGGDPTGGMLGTFRLSDDSVLAAFAVMLLVGIFSGLIPAISAMRLRVVDALRRI